MISRWWRCERSKASHFRGSRKGAKDAYIFPLRLCAFA
jgi:hypothetical protein